MNILLVSVIIDFAFLMFLVWLLARVNRILI